MTEEPFQEILKILAKDRRYDLCSVLISLLDELEEEDDVDFEPIEEGEPIDEYLEISCEKEKYSDKDVGITHDGFLYLKD
tara:strand:+ start:53 stop:292 length:240 start_codon:yes stop_codon:yes gene_type:complete